jgi:hypothetical protein
LYFPENLIPLICEEYPPYSALSDRHQRNIATMLWMWSDPRSRHTEYSSCVALTHRDLERIWGDSATAQRFIGEDYFSVVQGSNLGSHGISNAYRPYDYLGRALIRCFCDASPVRLIDTKSGRAVTKPRSAVASRARSKDGSLKNSVWTGVTIRKEVHVQPHAVLKFLSTCNDPIELAGAGRLLRLSGNQWAAGMLPLRFEQKSTGRIYEVFSGVQNIPRKVREAAFAGAWDYDISNCHFSILGQSACKAGYEVPYIDEYLKNKRAIRQRLAKACGCSEDSVKQCLIALVYGAPPSTSKRATIGRELGEARARVFISDRLVKGLYGDLKRVGKDVIAAMPSHRGRKVNTLGLDASADKESVLLAHVLQGIEARALRAVMRRYGETILVPFHDGWLSAQQLDVKELSSVIECETGYRFDIESRLLPVVDECRMQSRNEKESLKYIYNHMLSVIGDNFSRSSTRPYPSSLVVSARPAWSRPPGLSGPAASGRKGKKFPRSKS